MFLLNDDDDDDDDNDADDVDDDRSLTEHVNGAERAENGVSGSGAMSGC